MARHVYRYNRPVTEPHAERSGWTPELCITGRVRPPASKSIAIRSLLAAALADGTTRIRIRSKAEDVRAARELVAALVDVQDCGQDTWEITGRPPQAGGLDVPDGVDVGESGTLARLATAVLAFCGTTGRRQVIRASGSLLKRESRALLAALHEAQVPLELLHTDANRRGWPLAVTSIPPPDVVWLESPASSQEASGLALALAACPGRRVLSIRGPVPSLPYFRLTLAVLERFRARCLSAGSSYGAEGFLVGGGLFAPEIDLDIESDASAAAVALAAACLSGGEMLVEGVGSHSLQGDLRIVEHLAAFGCNARAADDTLHADGSPHRGAQLDLEGEPDLAPVLAAVAGVVALRGLGSSRLTGLGTLDGKESPRLQVLGSALRAVGCIVETDDRSMSIATGPRTTEPLVLDPCGDHRMAFAFALLGLERAGLTVSDPGCVAKSWPSFWSDLA